TWTVLIIYAFAQRLAGPWFKYLGLLAAALIAVGVFVPLDVPGADFANFVGYILWSVWLLIFAVFIWRRSSAGDQAPPQLATWAGCQKPASQGAEQQPGLWRK